MALTLSTSPAGGAAEEPPPATAPLMTMGVEEEFLLVDRTSRAPVGRGPRVIEAAARTLGPFVQPEFFTAQVEVCTSPTSDTSALRADLAGLRAALVRAADDEGCLLLASGTPVIPPERPLTVTPEARYRRMAADFASAVGACDQVVSGCHVHVGVSGHAEALRLANRMRPWLPTLQAVAANSPFDRGRDSGYASWRSVEHARWPTVGPAPVLDEAGYERVADTLVRSGAVLDRRMIYWFARPSEHVPTLEIRVADTNSDLDTVVLLAVLVRGLAATLREEPARGGPPPSLGYRALREAHRLAAVHGLAGDGLDLAAGRRVPAWELVWRLRERAAPGLAASGDLGRADELLGRLRERGGGADRQRAAHRRRGRLGDVVDSLARSTAAA
ncbi:putative glutamate--cysteine ligase 2-3 [Streptomyces subrutilus]|uniref:Putative glutamate--cysteine ligase 2 n=1 Tax=Streptomyces subrutilus TaxID=36818 RepID=A0A5P2UWA7_9ACTN|nr:glutamate--cysteine ligase [Streptomyces subrutilus]QEU82525.1 YbdK family carboxylate-amine ligase [Streptomyces subrutilus]GGZ81821.1 putative glutamate--cysteine ligase 2-3 [Streptomyces subrutilus]